MFSLKLSTTYRGVVIMTMMLLLFPLVVGDLFDTFDINSDGSIDRQEYTDGMAKLTAALEGPIPPAAASWLTYLPDVRKGFWKAFTSSVMMILATEIGDKTFFIAAVLSMKYDRLAVFSGALVALIVMTILSTVMGLVLPTILPKSYTHILGGILFLYFGVKMLRESRAMEANRVSEELEEVEEELLIDDKKRDSATTDEEAQQPKPSSPKKTSAALNTWQVCLQAFTLTFLAEWGDRSQIATIALSAAKNPYGVTVGGCVGHFMCTGLAVLGGRMLAARISEKTVAFWGSLIFLVFGIHSVFFES